MYLIKYYAIYKSDTHAFSFAFVRLDVVMYVTMTM
jgi:hypothetical protein